MRKAEPFAYGLDQYCLRWLVVGPSWIRGQPSSLELTVWQEIERRTPAHEPGTVWVVWHEAELAEVEGGASMARGAAGRGPFARGCAS